MITWVGMPLLSARVYIMMCSYGYLGRGAAAVRQDGYYDVFIWLPEKGCR